MLSESYVAIPCAMSVCYQWHMSPYLVLCLCATSDICRHTLCYVCVLSASYVAIPYAMSACYQWHMSPYLVLCLCAISDICRHSFMSLNFTGIISIAVVISTQISMMSFNKNEAVNAAICNMFTRHFVEFEWCFCSKTDYFTGNWGTNTIKHVSEMELYNILPNLDNQTESFNNEISADEMVVGAHSSP